MKKQYSEQERNEAMKLAQEIGTASAARRLGINVDTLYTWQNKEKKRAMIETTAPSGTELTKEVTQLRRKLKEQEEEIEILQDALSFFVKRRKK